MHNTFLPDQAFDPVGSIDSLSFIARMILRPMSLCRMVNAKLSDEIRLTGEPASVSRPGRDLG